MIQAAQYDVPALLEMAGAHPRRNRHDCPKCKGFRTVTHTDEVFHCHGCGWSGNAITLAKELGVHQRLPRDEYHKLRRRRERAHDAAQRLYGAVQRHRKGLLDRLHGLNRLEAACHNIGPTETAWEGVQMVDGKRPGILAELTLMENATAAALFRFFLAGSEARRVAIGRVLKRRGFTPRAGEFVEVQP